MYFPRQPGDTYAPVVKPPQQTFCYHGNVESHFSSSLFHAFRSDIAFPPVNSGVPRDHDLQKVILYRLYQYLPAFLDTCTGLPRGNVHYWTGLRCHARCHPYPIPQPVKVGHTTGVYYPYSFRTVVGFFYVPQDQISAVRRHLRFFVLILELETRKSVYLQMSLQRQHFLLSYLKTLSVGPAGVWTCDLPLGRPTLSQMS